MAHLSSAILSATMAWHLVIKDSRFTFSHEFSQILLSQFECWLLGEDIQCRYRRRKNKETGWMDSNLFQYIYRPENDDFDRLSVWEFFQGYEMKLISSLSNSQKENLENDYEENFFFRFSEKYPGYEFACVERLRFFKVPMLYYKDHIPDLENCELRNDSEKSDVTIGHLRNDYATKMLLLFYPFREITDFPLYEQRWNFFREAQDNGFLYWDAKRIMQNIQDVENSKKIISKQEMTPNSTKLDSSFDISSDESSTDGESDTQDHDMSLKKTQDHDIDEDLDVIFEEFGFHDEIGNIGNFTVDGNICGNLRRKMKKQHVISYPVSTSESALIQGNVDVDGQIVASQSNIKASNNGSDDLIRVILNLNRNVEDHQLNWGELEKHDVTDFDEFPLSMKSCISHYNLDLKQAAAFNVICSSFMLAHLEDPSLEKPLNCFQLHQAKQILLAKGGLGKLVMNLTGSGGSGKSFVLEAIKSFCKQFCKAIGKPFNDSVFIVTATTNTAAAQIKGDTIHSIAGLRRKLSRVLKNWSLNWLLAKLLFIDEISMMDILDFLKLDKYLRRLMAQFNPDALNHPFGGLNIVFCGDFSQLNPVGHKDVIYDHSKNILWGMINRVVNLTITNWRFKDDPVWGNLLQRIHHGQCSKEDLNIINTRVVGPNLSLPTVEELQGGDITYACYTNAERNLISDNIFATILESRHPKKDCEQFEIPEQTLIIKGNFADFRTNEPKSVSYHKLVHGHCGDDNIQCGNGQNIIRVDPCLKLFVGCPLMVSVNDFKKDGVVKGTTGKFKGVILKEFKERKIEIWNGYKVYTVEACDVKHIVCYYTRKHTAEQTKTFIVPVKTFEVTVKFPLSQGRKFLRLAKSRITQFPVNNDLATTGHKLQGMTKQKLIVSQLNYSTPNWVYVVLSRVTSLNGLFLLQPIKENFNPQPSKVLQNEWKRQRHQELELLLFLRQSGNFPEDVNVNDLALKINIMSDNSLDTQTTITLLGKPKRKNKKAISSSSKKNQGTSTYSTKFDLWFTKNRLRIVPHLSNKNGNCLFESVASFLELWKGKPVELRYKSLLWAETQVSQGTQWGMMMWRDFEVTKANQDCYNNNSYMEYLKFMKDPKVFGTEYDIIMLCEFLQLSIKVFSPSLFFEENGLVMCQEPVIYGNQLQNTIQLWLCNEHYEPIHNVW